MQKVDEYWGQIPIPIMQKSPGLPRSSYQLLARVALGFATDDTRNAIFVIAALARIHSAAEVFCYFLAWKRRIQGSMPLLAQFGQLPG